jgi:tetratricopeptide (TPR) repeat protein
VVFAARDPSSGREVAIKVLLTGAGAPPSRRSRFQREAQTLARLRHPNVVRVHSAGEDRGRPYLVLELVEDESLADLLRRRGLLEPREAVTIALQLARGLAHAHQQGILHRDLKPANVLLRDGRALLTDFGLAKDLYDSEQLTRTGVLLGTPGYFPPEQASGDLRALGPQSDVFSLGATLYEMLCGQVPFRGSSLADLIATLREVPPPPSTLQPGLDPRLDAICLACLDPVPAKRYPTADALADELEGWLEADSAPAARVNGRWRYLVVAGLGYALGVGTVLWVRPSVPANPGPPPASPEPAVSRVEVATLLAEAEAAYADRRYDVALASYSEVLVRAPETVEAWVGRGRVHLDHFRLEPAREDLVRATQLDPAAAEAWSLLASCECEADRHEDALAAAERAIELDDSLALPYLVRAFLHLTEERPQEALRDCARARDRDPSLALIDVAESSAHLQSGQLDEALEAASRALDQEPGHPEAHAARAMIFFARRQSEALAELDAFDAAPTLEPGRWRVAPEQRAEMLLLRAKVCYAVVDEDEAAVSACTRGLALAPDHAGLLLMRGLARASLSEGELAAADLRAATEHGDESIQLRALYQLGVVTYEDIDDDEAALKLFDRVKALDPDYRNLYYQRARVRLSLGQVSAALAECDEGERRGQGDRSGLWQVRGNVYSVQKRWEEAVQAYDRGLELSEGQNVFARMSIASARNRARTALALAAGDPLPGKEPRDAKDYARRAKLILSLGYPQRALEDCERALEHDPSYDQALELRGQALKQLEERGR